MSALQAQANSYLALKDGPQLAASAGKLVAAEPLNQDALRLQRAGYQLSKQPKEANAVAEQILGLPAKVADHRAHAEGGERHAGWHGHRPAGHGRQDGQGPIAAAPFTLVFEMLDKSGKTVATQEVAFEPLAPDATKDFSFEAKGEGISSYRYTVKK